MGSMPPFPTWDDFKDRSPVVPTWRWLVVMPSLATGQGVPNLNPVGELGVSFIENITYPLSENNENRSVEYGGRVFYFPGNKQIGTATITFMEDNEASALSYILLWRSLIVDHEDNYGLPNGPNGYRKNIDIYNYNDTDNENAISITTLFGCFPYSVDERNLTYTDSGHLVLSVQFAVNSIETRTGKAVTNPVVVSRGTTIRSAEMIAKEARGFGSLMGAASLFGNTGYFNDFSPSGLAGTIGSITNFRNNPVISGLNLGGFIGSNNSTLTLGGSQRQRGGPTDALGISLSGLPGLLGGGNKNGPGIGAQVTLGGVSLSGTRANNGNLNVSGGVDANSLARLVSTSLSGGRSTASANITNGFSASLFQGGYSRGNQSLGINVGSITKSFGRLFG